MSGLNFKLTRNAAGRLVLVTSAGVTFEGVVAARAFPISAPTKGISLLDAEGHELLWIDRLSELPEASRVLIEAELLQREFMPEIVCIKQVSGFTTPCKWLVSTTRGDTELLLNAEDHIRRLTHSALLITDGHGVSYLVHDVETLDSHSRRLLDRFL